MDSLRRGLLGGAVLGVMAVAGRASAQNAPQTNGDADKLQQALVQHDGPDLKVEPIGQDWANLHRYRASNAEVAAMPSTARRVVMMGDSITDNWARPEYSGTFYADNGLIGRGISGQVTAQMLVRFMAEVVALKPEVVHILAGTNDIAENTDPYNALATQNNLAAMAALATANGIKVIMGSVPPATSFAWRPEVGNPVDKIRALNAWIKATCAERGYVYADYWLVLANPDGGLKHELGIGGDSVHPNAEGYALMGPLTLAYIERARV